MFNNNHTSMYYSIKHMFKPENYPFFGELKTLWKNLNIGYLICLEDTPIGFASISYDNEYSILIISEYQNKNYASIVTKIIQNKYPFIKGSIDSNNLPALIVKSKL